MHVEEVVVIELRNFALALFGVLSGSVVAFADVDECVSPALPFGGENGTPQSVTSTIAVTDTFVIANLEVVIDITHPYVGDIILDLTSPGGTSVVLHNGEGGSADDLQLTYSDAGAPN